MRRVVVVLAALAVCCGAAFAQSAKVATQVGNVTLIDWQSESKPWTGLLTATIKTSQQKDLFIGVSLETGLLTRTLVRSKNLDADTSEAVSGIEVRVWVDDKLAEPGEVMFDKRKQVLTAKFAGMLSNCTDLNGDGVVTIPEECTVTEEELELLLDTMGAHHFNFVLDDVGVGSHTLKVEAKITLGTQVVAGSAEAKALVGKGSLTVEEVRLVKGTDITL